MSAKVMSEAAIQIPQSEMITCQNDIKSVNCVCCGLMEECTVAYIESISERFSGKWICGLCSEAVKDEMVRCKRLISWEEALSQHMTFCKKFSSPPVNSTLHLISAMRRILRRGFESGSFPSSPVKSERTILIRSESCIATLAGVQDC